MDDVALFRCRGRRADLTPFGPAGGPTSLERPSAVCRVLFGRSPLTRLQLIQDLFLDLFPPHSEVFVASSLQIHAGRSSQTTGSARRGDVEQVGSQKTQECLLPIGGDEVPHRYIASRCCTASAIFSN